MLVPYLTIKWNTAMECFGGEFQIISHHGSTTKRKPYSLLQKKKKKNNTHHHSRNCLYCYYIVTKWWCDYWTFNTQLNLSWQLHLHGGQVFVSWKLSTYWRMGLLQVSLTIFGRYLFWWIVFGTIWTYDIPVTSWFPMIFGSMELI